MTTTLGSSELLLEFLALALEACGPAYAEQLVVVGGAASALYTMIPQAQNVPLRQSIFTPDLDFAARTLQKVAGELRPPLEQLLLAGGFIDDPNARVTHDGQLISRYRPTNELLAREGFYLEFLTPLQGDGRDRRTSKPIICATLQPPITAQPLRYLDLLLFEPLEFIVPRRSYPTAKLAQPATYVIQKTLISDERRLQGGGKFAKDCAYVYDTARLFRDRAEEMFTVPLRKANAHGGFPAQWFKKAAKCFERLYCSAASEGAAAVVGYYGGALTPGEVTAVMAELVEAVRTGCRK
jgi:hypothetical protein